MSVLIKDKTVGGKRNFITPYFTFYIYISRLVD